MPLEINPSPKTNGSSSTLGHTEWTWRPQPGPQKALVDCPFSEVFFGGARGGGKTDGVLGKWALKERRYGAPFNAIMFRRTTVSAEDAIERSKEIYGPLGGRFNEQKLRWRMPNGGRVSFAYLDGVTDADEYQGRNVTDAWVEEAGQYPTSTPIDRLFGVLRSAHGVPIQIDPYREPWRRGPALDQASLRAGAVSEVAEGHHATGSERNDSQDGGDPVAHHRQPDHARKGSGLHRSIAPRWLSAAHQRMA